MLRLQWVSDIREKVTLGDGRPLPVLLLANKCDIDSITIHPDVISNFCKQHHIDAWFLTSAKEDINIGNAASCRHHKYLTYYHMEKLLHVLLTLTHSLVSLFLQERP